jgi:RNA polymerase-binding transcription factor DksA
MDLWVVVGILVVGVVAVSLWRRRRGSRREPQERPVLPSHYSSLLQIDRSRYPGLCTACGTENTPGYNYCMECGERLPGGSHERTETDVSEIFGE